MQEKVNENVKLKTEMKNMDDETHELSEALFQVRTVIINYTVIITDS